MNILLLTDLHWAGSAAGFHQQPRWLDGGPRLVERLRDLLAAHKVDLLVTLGDMVEGGGPEEVAACVRVLKTITTPTLLCLGNHDLAQQNSLAAWQTALDGWPQAMLADSLVETPALDIIGLNTHWLSPDGDPRLYWPLNTNPVPAITHHQLTNLSAWLARNPERPALIAMHCPLDGLPPELTGLATSIHDAPSSFTQPFADLLAKHPRAKLVIGGHCHATCCTRMAARAQISLAAFGEVPCQYALVTVADGKVDLQVHALDPTDAGVPALEPAKRWALGRPTDRAVSLA